MRLVGPEKDVLLLNRDDVPDGSLIAIFSDVHIGIEDKDALSLAVDCCEAEGVTHVIGNGDMFDCAAASRHPRKKEKATLDFGSLLQEIEPGRWFVEWARTRWNVWGTGNHEDWINQAVEADPMLVDTVTVKSALRLPDDLIMLPNGYQIRLGSMLWEHGDHIFKGATNGGVHPARKVLDTYPENTTMVGHVHRMSEARRTTPGRDGILNSRRALTTGHMSLEHAHRDYAPRHPGWHQSFTLERVYWEGGKAKYTIYPVEIFRDRRNKPAFEFNGKRYHV